MPCICGFQLERMCSSMFDRLTPAAERRIPVDGYGSAVSSSGCSAKCCNAVSRIMMCPKHLLESAEETTVTPGQKGKAPQPEDRLNRKKTDDRALVPVDVDSSLLRVKTQLFFDRFECRDDRNVARGGNVAAEVRYEGLADGGIVAVLVGLAVVVCDGVTE